MSEQQTNAVPSAECREAFEQWIQTELNYGYDLTRDADGNYPHDSTDTAWLAWQAAWNRRTSPSPAEVSSDGLPIGYRIISRNTGKTMGYYYTENEARDLFDIYFPETLYEVRPMFDASAINRRLAVKETK